MKKPSLLERLTGGMGPQDGYDDLFEDEQALPATPAEKRLPTHNTMPSHQPPEQTETEQVGELAVDVYQTATHVVVKALIAGVTPQNIEIALTREMLTIKGVREDEREVEGDGYFQRELYWGAFSRTILLPEEVDVDAAEASEKHGILVIRLPKINKAKQTKLKIKAR